MKKIALSLVLVSGLALAACSKPAEEAPAADAAVDAAAPAEDAMAAPEAAADAAAPAADAAAPAADAAAAAPAEEMK